VAHGGPLRIRILLTTSSLSRAKSRACPSRAHRNPVDPAAPTSPHGPHPPSWGRGDSVVIVRLHKQRCRRPAHSEDRTGRSPCACAAQAQAQYDSTSASDLTPLSISLSPSSPISLSLSVFSSGNDLIHEARGQESPLHSSETAPRLSLRVSVAIRSIVESEPAREEVLAAASTSTVLLARRCRDEREIGMRVRWVSFVHGG